MMMISLDNITNGTTHILHEHGIPEHTNVKRLCEAIFLVLLCIFGCTGNTYVIGDILSSVDLRRSACSVLLVACSLADGAVTWIYIPFQAAAVQWDIWPTYITACRVIGALSSFLINFTLCAHGTLTVYQFIQISRQSNARKGSHEKLVLSGLVFIIAILSFVAFVLPYLLIPNWPHFNEDLNNCIADTSMRTVPRFGPVQVVIVCLVLFITVLFCIKIAIILRKMIRNTMSAQTRDKCLSLYKLTSIRAAVFMICYLSAVLANFLVQMDSVDPLIARLFSYLVLVAATVNPYLFVFFMVRETFVTRCLKKCLRRDDPDLTKESDLPSPSPS